MDSYTENEMKKVRQRLTFWGEQRRFSRQCLLNWIVKFFRHCLKNL